MDDWRAGGFGLYIHWPYCQAKCPYCDFNSHVVDRIEHDVWRSAYLSEIKRLSEFTGDRTLSSVYFGGGTPSLMEAETVAAILEAVRAGWPRANDFEVTLEANPTSVEAAKFRAFRDAGVSRVSMGIQALNDKDLKRLGRLHSVAEAETAFDIARACFDEISFDLIYARQDQTLTDWREELQRALAMAADHLSLYQLTIEAGTAFGDRYDRGGLRGLPDEDLGADMFALTQDLCDAAGLPAYEVSNHARDGHLSKHNLIYWRYGDYAGIGPGAHGRLTLNGQRYATETDSAPLAWLKRVRTQGCGDSALIPLDPSMQASEYAMMAMRLGEGMDLDRFERLSGSALNPAAVKACTEWGLIEIEHRHLRATGAGRAVLNSVLLELLADA